MDRLCGEGSLSTLWNGPTTIDTKNSDLILFDFRKMTKFRVYSNRLQGIQTKIHEREAYIKALESGEIDTIIDIIRKQKVVDDAGNTYIYACSYFF